MLPRLELGFFGETSLRGILLLHALFALGAPIRPLVLVGPLLALFGRRAWAHGWYRFVHYYCYWRGVRRAVPDRDTWNGLTQGAIILMYHAFGSPSEPASRFVLPARRFARQMAWLKRRRYTVLSLGQFLRYRREHQLPPARSVVITFDDGYADNQTLAYPILRRFGFPATIFVVSGAMGTTNLWDRDAELAGRSAELVGRPLMSWQSIRELLDQGVEFGAHTRTHPALPTLPMPDVEREVSGSRNDLERELGIYPLAFAYPYGDRDRAVEAIVRQAGFPVACGIHPGFNSPGTLAHALRRVEIRGTDSLYRFALAVSLGDTRLITRLWNGR
jgi:peptidoglycan/xylan/chitin deacetylase (PgdA/CDA1 family)